MFHFPTITSNLDLDYVLGDDQKVVPRNSTQGSNPRQRVESFLEGVHSDDDLQVGGESQSSDDLQVDGESQSSDDEEDLYVPNESEDEIDPDEILSFSRRRDNFFDDELTEVQTPGFGHNHGDEAPVGHSNVVLPDRRRSLQSQRMEWL